MDIILYDFNPLSEFGKWEVLSEHGVQLSERFNKDYGYSLYQIDGFYLGVQYRADKRNYKIDILSTSIKLEPYLDKIDISQLF